MPTNKKGRDLSRLGLVGNAQAGAAWQSLVQSADLPGERLEGARELPIELIEANSEQPRKRFDPQRLEDLAASISEDGVIQPIVVRPDGEQPGRYMIVAGERRWRASQLAGLTTIPAIITEEEDDAAIARKMLRENVEREDLDVEDLGIYLQTLYDAGATQRDLAELTHFSTGKVNGLLQLVKHPELVERIRSGELTQEQAIRTIANARKGLSGIPRITQKPRDPVLRAYQPLSAFVSWVGTFRAERVPTHQRPALREHIRDTIERLNEMYDALDDEPEDDEQ
jgi:ParB/RepB/Spo0J family partition protein